MTRLGLILVPLALAACQPGFNAQPITDADACGASRLQGLVGQDVVALQAFPMPPNLRIIRHDMMVTQDYSPSRLNVYLDSRAQISQVSCG